MTKKIAAGIALAAVALIAFNYVSTGEITLIPTTPLSAEARQLGQLHDRFVTATHRLNQAEKAAGATGLDTSSDAQAALTELDSIERELKELKGKTTAADENAKIDQILSDIARIRGR